MVKGEQLRAKLDAICDASLAMGAQTNTLLQVCTVELHGSSPQEHYKGKGGVFSFLSIVFTVNVHGRVPFVLFSGATHIPDTLLCLSTAAYASNYRNRPQTPSLPPPQFQVEGGHLLYSVACENVRFA